MRGWPVPFVLAIAVIPNIIAACDQAALMDVFGGLNDKYKGANSISAGKNSEELKRDIYSDCWTSEIVASLLTQLPVVGHRVLKDPSILIWQNFVQATAGNQPYKADFVGSILVPVFKKSNKFHDTTKYIALADIAETIKVLPLEQTLEVFKVIPKAKVKELAAACNPELYSGAKASAFIQSAMAAYVGKVEEDIKNGQYYSCNTKPELRIEAMTLIVEGLPGPLFTSKNDGLKQVNDLLKLIDSKVTCSGLYPKLYVSLLTKATTLEPLSKPEVGKDGINRSGMPVAIWELFADATKSPNPVRDKLLEYLKGIDSFERLYEDVLCISPLDEIFLPGIEGMEYDYKDRGYDIEEAACEEKSFVNDVPPADAKKITIARDSIRSEPGILELGMTLLKKKIADIESMIPKTDPAYPVNGIWQMLGVLGAKGPAIIAANPNILSKMLVNTDVSNVVQKKAMFAFFAMQKASSEDEAMSPCVDRNWQLFTLLSETKRGESNVALSAIAGSHKAFPFAANALKKDPVFVKEAIEKNWRVLKYADDRAEKEYFSAALQDTALMLGAAKKDFRALKVVKIGLLKPNELLPLSTGRLVQKYLYPAKQTDANKAEVQKYKFAMMDRRMKMLGAQKLAEQPLLEKADIATLVAANKEDVLKLNVATLLGCMMAVAKQIVTMDNIAPMGGFVRDVIVHGDDPGAQADYTRKDLDFEGAVTETKLDVAMAPVKGTKSDALFQLNIKNFEAWATKQDFLKSRTTEVIDANEECTDNLCVFKTDYTCINVEGKPEVPPLVPAQPNSFTIAWTRSKRAAMPLVSQKIANGLTVSAAQGLALVVSDEQQQQAFKSGDSAALLTVKEVVVQIFAHHAYPWPYPNLVGLETLVETEATLTEEASHDGGNDNVPFQLARRLALRGWTVFTSGKTPLEPWTSGKAVSSKALDIGKRNVCDYHAANMNYIVEDCHNEITAEYRDESRFSKSQTCFKSIMKAYTGNCYKAINEAAKACKTWPHCSGVPEEPPTCKKTGHDDDDDDSICPTEDPSTICGFDDDKRVLKVANTQKSAWPAYQQCFYNALEHLLPYTVKMWKTNAIKIPVDTDKGGVGEANSQWADYVDSNKKRPAKLKGMSVVFRVGWMDFFTPGMFADAAKKPKTGSILRSGQYLSTSWDTFYFLCQERIAGVSAKSEVRFILFTQPDSRCKPLEENNLGFTGESELTCFPDTYWELFGSFTTDLSDSDRSVSDHCDVKKPFQTYVLRELSAAERAQAKNPGAPIPTEIPSYVPPVIKKKMQNRMAGSAAKLKAAKLKQDPHDTFAIRDVGSCYTANEESCAICQNVFNHANGKTTDVTWLESDPAFGAPEETRRQQFRGGKRQRANHRREHTALVAATETMGSLRFKDGVDVLLPEKLTTSLPTCGTKAPSSKYKKLGSKELAACRELDLKGTAKECVDYYGEYKKGAEVYTRKCQKRGFVAKLLLSECTEDASAACDVAVAALLTDTPLTPDSVGVKVPIRAAASPSNAQAPFKESAPSSRVPIGEVAHPSTAQAHLKVSAPSSTTDVPDVQDLMKQRESAPQNTQASLAAQSAATKESSEEEAVMATRYTIAFTGADRKAAMDMLTGSWIYQGKSKSVMHEVTARTSNNMEIFAFGEHAKNSSPAASLTAIKICHKAGCCN